MRKTLAPLAIASTLLLAACAPATPGIPGGAPATYSTSILGDRDTGWEVSVAEPTVLLPGRFEIEIPGVSGGIGDQWEISRDPDPAVLQPLEQTYTADTPGAVGGYGVLVLPFEAVGPGTTTIELQYRYRGDIPTGAPGEPVTVTVTVEQPS